MYLESSKESNIAYYRRFGFEVRRELHLKKGPTMWLMEPCPERTGRAGFDPGLRPQWRRFCSTRSERQ